MEPQACIYGRIGGDAVEQWLHDVRQPGVEVTLPAQSLGPDVWLSLTVEEDAAKGSRAAVVNSMTCAGFAQKWNAVHPQQKLRKGDKLSHIDGIPVPHDRDLA